MCTVANVVGAALEHPLEWRTLVVGPALERSPQPRYKLPQSAKTACLPPFDSPIAPSGRRRQLRAYHPGDEGGSDRRREAHLAILGARRDEGQARVRQALHRQAAPHTPAPPP